MKEISQIDKNFRVESALGKNDIVFYNALSKPFSVHGVFYENGKYRRLPEAVAGSVSEGVYSLHDNTAGGRVRFKTNSPYIAIRAKMSGIGKMPHFALCGSAGFDMYVKNDYVASFMPPFSIENGYDGVIDFPEAKMREITINFPLYSGVEELYIGLSKDAKVLAPKPYKTVKPIVYYGSSITQGGCASRPGNAYEAIISRALNVDHVNLGFSGNAKGEDEMTDYIKTLPMSVFVYDYDYNAPTAEHLAKTHEKMFLAIREWNKNIPIVMVSRIPRPVERFGTAETDERYAIIKRTFDNAIAAGDENVYLIDGRELLSPYGMAATVDGVHPTDLGFYLMAKGIGKVLKNIL